MQKNLGDVIAGSYAKFGIYLCITEKKYSFCGFGEIRRDFSPFFPKSRCLKNKSGTEAFLGHRTAFRGFV